MEKVNLTAVNGPVIKLSIAGSPVIRVSFEGGQAVTLKRQEGPVIKLITQAPALLKFNIGKTLYINNTEYSNITGSPADNQALVDYIKENLAAADLSILQQITNIFNNTNNENNIPDTVTSLISGLIIWKSELTYTSTDIEYQILGTKYTAQAKNITLTPADPNYSRIDLFYVDVFGNLQVKTGVPAVNPASPILTETQLEVMSVIVNPGATQPEGIDVDVVYDENAEWTTSETHDNYINVDFAAASEPLKGIKRVKVAIEIPDTISSSPLHFIGEEYQGGIIFWLDATGKKGLIAAKNDAAIDVFWSSLSGHPVYTTGANGIEIGTGQANTALMLANSAAKDHAVKYADELIVSVYDDWFLPSEKELDAMYFRRYAIGNFGNKTYWSSTEVTGSYSWKKARCISFSDGSALTRDKNNRFCVRPIRAFDDTLLPVNVPVDYYTVLNTKLTFASTDNVATKDGILSFNIKSSAPWRFNSTLLIETYLSGVKTGSASLSPSTNMAGFKSNSSDWQFLAIPMSRFSTSRDTFDALRITLVGSWPNGIDLGFDDIRYQHTTIVTEGVVVTPGTYGLSLKSAVITVNAQGVVTNIMEVDTNPVDERLTGIVDSINKIFATSTPYQPGTVTLFRCGLKYSDFAEVPDSDTLIELAEAPINTPTIGLIEGYTDVIEATYVKKQI